MLKIINRNNIFISLLFMCIFGHGIVFAGPQLETKNFQITYKVPLKFSAIPLNRIHSWILYIEDKKLRPVVGAKVIVKGGMPAHNHGLPTEPKVKEIGKGKYILEGLKFSMKGEWVLEFEILSKNLSEKATLNLNL